MLNYKFGCLTSDLKNVGINDLFKVAKTVRLKDWTWNQRTSLRPLPNQSLLSANTVICELAQN